MCSSLSEFTLFVQQETGNHVVIDTSNYLSIGARVAIGFGILVFITLALLIVLLIIFLTRRERRLEPGIMRMELQPVSVTSGEQEPVPESEKEPEIEPDRTQTDPLNRIFKFINVLSTINFNFKI